MPEKLDQTKGERGPEQRSTPESIERLRRLFSEAEKALETEGREAAKPLLDEIYAVIIELNNPNAPMDAVRAWNPKGRFAKDEFNELNLRRKKLSNAVGIMTQRGVVRHDLNEI